MARLGGPEPHGRRSGVVHVITDTDREALATAADIVALLVDKRRVRAGGRTARSATLLPESPRRAYDVHPLVDGLLDEPGIELHAQWAPNIVTTLGRLGGGTVGVLANNPLRLGGCLDAASAEKAARFVRMCDAFGVPLVVLVDVPGYLPGVAQEWDGVVRRGAKLLHAFAEATVPRVTVVTRKAYGGAYIAMNSRSLDATRVFAWPTAEVAVMGAVAAVRVLKRRQIAAVSRSSERAGARGRARRRARDRVRRRRARGRPRVWSTRSSTRTRTRGAVSTALAAAGCRAPGSTETSRCDRRQAGRSVLVTGGNRGIGLGIARCLVAGGSSGRGHPSRKRRTRRAVRGEMQRRRPRLGGGSSRARRRGAGPGRGAGRGGGHRPATG